MKKIIHKIFMYIFKNELEKLNKEFSNGFKNLDERLIYINNQITNKVREEVSKECINNQIAILAKKEIDSRGLACAIDLDLYGKEAQVIIIGNNKGKHYVNSFYIHCDSIYDLSRTLQDIEKNNGINFQRHIIDGLDTNQMRGRGFITY